MIGEQKSINQSINGWNDFVMIWSINKQTNNIETFPLISQMMMMIFWNLMNEVLIKYQFRKGNIILWHKKLESVLQDDVKCIHYIHQPFIETKDDFIEIISKIKKEKWLNKEKKKSMILLEST